jgi:hypothetical protein
MMQPHDDSLLQLWEACWLLRLTLRWLSLSIWCHAVSKGKSFHSACNVRDMVVEASPPPFATTLAHAHLETSSKPEQVGWSKHLPDYHCG